MASKFSIKAVFKAVDEITAPVSKMQKATLRFTRSLERGFRRVDRSVSKLAKMMRTDFRRGAILLTSAIASVGLAIKKVADRADVLSKKAKILDMPITDLQEWQFAAEQSGVSSDSLTKSLGMLEKQIGQAKTGTGTLVTILKKSNPLLLRQLITTKNTSQAFNVMLKALRSVKDPAQRAALAYAAFGREGLSLVRMAQTSEKSLAKLREEARKNGVITQQQATAAEAFNDQLNSLQHTLQGVLQDALLPLMPIMTKYLKITQNWIFANRELIRTDIQKFIKAVGEAIQFLVKHGKTIATVIIVFMSLMAVLRTFIVVMTAVNLVLALNPIGLIIIAVTAFIGVILLLTGHLKKAAQAIWSFFKDIVKFFAKLISKVGHVTKEIIKFFAPFHKTHVIKTKIQAKTDIPKTIKPKTKVVLTPFIKQPEKPLQLKAMLVKPGTSTISVKPEMQTPTIQPQMISPQERIAKTIDEKRSIQKTEVTIKDDTGKAEVTSGKMSNGLQLARSGAF